MSTHHNQAPQVASIFAGYGWNWKGIIECHKEIAELPDTLQESGSNPLVRRERAIWFSETGAPVTTFTHEATIVCGGLVRRGLLAVSSGAVAPTRRSPSSASGVDIKLYEYQISRLPAVRGELILKEFGIEPPVPATQLDFGDLLRELERGASGEFQNPAH